MTEYFTLAIAYSILIGFYVFACRASRNYHASKRPRVRGAWITEGIDEDELQRRVEVQCKSMHENQKALLAAAVSLENVLYGIITSVSSAILGVSVTYYAKLTEDVSPRLIILLWVLSVVTIIIHTFGLMLLARYYDKHCQLLQPFVWTHDAPGMEKAMEKYNTEYYGIYHGLDLIHLGIFLFCNQLFCVLAIGIQLAFAG